MHDADVIISELRQAVASALDTQAAQALSLEQGRQVCNNLEGALVAAQLTISRLYNDLPPERAAHWRTELGLREHWADKLPETFDYSVALRLLREGYCCARTGWNGKNMFIFLVPASDVTVDRAPLLSIFEEGTVLSWYGYLAMRTADGKLVPWLCSQTDALAGDWCVASAPDAEKGPL